MTTFTNHFVLGADDPEMREMERVLKEHGCSYEYAQSAGKRVHPGNAYKADAVQVVSRSR